MKDLERCRELMNEVPKLMKRKNNQLEIYVVRKVSHLVTKFWVYYQGVRGIPLLGRHGKRNPSIYSFSYMCLNQKHCVRPITPTHTTPFFWFSLRIFRLAGPPQRWTAWPPKKIVGKCLFDRQTDDCQFGNRTGSRLQLSSAAGTAVMKIYLRLVFDSGMLVVLLADGNGDYLLSRLYLCFVENIKGYKDFRVAGENISKDSSNAWAYYDVNFWNPLFVERVSPLYARKSRENASR